MEAAEMFLSGNPLRSVVSRDGARRAVVWFQCEARLVRRENGAPWFMHGVGFDITELKQAERRCRKQRNVVSAILDTVGALGGGAGPRGPHSCASIARASDYGLQFRRCAREGSVEELFRIPEEREKVAAYIGRLSSGDSPGGT